jgi:hypothetical protein
MAHSLRWFYFPLKVHPSFSSQKKVYVFLLPHGEKVRMRGRKKHLSPCFPFRVNPFRVNPLRVNPSPQSGEGDQRG